MIPRGPPVSGALGLYSKGGYHGSLTWVPGKINSGPHWVFTKKSLSPLNTPLAPGYFFHVFKSKSITLMMTDTKCVWDICYLPSLLSCFAQRSNKQPPFRI